MINITESEYNEVINGLRMQFALARRSQADRARTLALEHSIRLELENKLTEANKIRDEAVSERKALQEIERWFCNALIASGLVSLEPNAAPSLENLLPQIRRDLESYNDLLVKRHNRRVKRERSLNGRRSAASLPLKKNGRRSAASLPRSKVKA